MSGTDIVVSAGNLMDGDGDDL